MLKEAIQYVLENMRPEAQNLGNRAYRTPRASAGKRCCKARLCETKVPRKHGKEELAP